MSTEQEALRLAERINAQTDWYEFDSHMWCHAAAAMLRKLVAEREADRAAMRDALEAMEYMHTEKCNYMRRNNLGDPLREDAARLAIPAITHLRQRLEGTT